MDSGVLPGAPRQAAVVGRNPLAVVVVDGDGLVSHWSSGARRLFGQVAVDAVGRRADDLMPVAGALAVEERGLVHGTTDSDPGSGSEGTPCPGQRGIPAYPTAGRATTPGPAGSRVDVLWWAYPLVGPGSGRHLVLATDARPPAAGTGARCAAGTRVAPGFARGSTDRHAQDLAGRLHEVLPGLTRAEAASITAQVLDLGCPVLDFARHEQVPLIGAVGPAAVSPDPASECAALRERLGLLLDVGDRVSAAPDLARAAREVVAATVPRFADFAGMHVRSAVLAGEEFPAGPPDPTTLWHRVCVEHGAETDRWDALLPVGETLSLPARRPFFRRMATGEPVLIGRLDAARTERIARSFEKRDLRPALLGRSLLVLPLTARDHVLGFLVLARGPEREPFDESDRATGTELAARAGLALDNARLRARQETVAETLQESMLPRIGTFRMPGCEIVTRYLPGAGRGGTGGDWFDAVRLPGPRTAFVVGDVMGHGLQAVATMGQLRTAVQTMALLDLEPARLLRGLDDLAGRLGSLQLASCLYAVYDPIARDLRLASAGHVPPVLVRAADGRGELLDLPAGAPIGVGGVAFETVRVPVSPGDRLVMCTDGLVELRDPAARDGRGLVALCEAAARAGGSTADACDAVIRALNVREGRRDDVALLMALLGGIPEQDVAEWQLALDPREVARARRLVQGRLLDWGLPEEVEATELMVSELVTNAVHHSRCRHVGLRLVRTPGAESGTSALLCEVSDDDPSPASLVDTRGDDESGRGLRVVSSLARDWGSSSTAQGKTVWFERTVGRGGS